MKNKDVKKEVEIGEKNNQGQEAKWRNWYKCPNCTDNNITNSQKYCGNCGTRLKWICS